MIIYLYLPLFCVSVERNSEWASLWRKWSWSLDHASSILSPAHTYTLELQTKVREYFTITEKAPSRAFSWLKAPTLAFTVKTLRLRLWLWNHRKPSFAALTHIHITNTSTLLPLHLQCAVWWWKYESWTLLQDHRCSDHDQPVKQDACNLHNTRHLQAA